MSKSKHNQASQLLLERKEALELIALIEGLGAPNSDSLHEYEEFQKELGLYKQLVTSIEREMGWKTFTF